VKKFLSLFHSPAVHLSWSFQGVGGSADCTVTE